MLIASISTSLLAMLFSNFAARSAVGFEQGRSRVEMQPVVAYLLSPLDVIVTYIIAKRFDYNENLINRILIFLRILTVPTSIDTAISKANLIG